MFKNKINCISLKRNDEIYSIFHVKKATSHILYNDFTPHSMLFQAIISDVSSIDIKIANVTKPVEIIIVR